MDTRIYIMTHKTFTKPRDELYTALHVGHALSPDLGYQGDDTGNHISTRNKSFCELTGIYWLWKNVRCDIIGICHYRRYFVHGENFLSAEYIESTLADYDVIIPNCQLVAYPNLREHYAHAHKEKDLIICREIVAELYPEYLPAFDHCMNCSLFTLGNMMICRKELFDKYCSWLFPILFEAERRIDISEYDTFQARIFGYLAERLLRVWLMHSTLRIREEEVRLMDPIDSENAVRSVQLKQQCVELLLRDLITLYESGNYYDLVDNSPLPVDFHEKIPVWVCWFQGMEQAPDLVKACIHSIRRNLPGDLCELHLITLENIGDYITLPEWIIRKFNNGIISYTHLSDILRMGLLYRYGGLWLDATYYVTKPFPQDFFTEQSFFTHKMTQPVWRADVTQGRWSGNFLYCQPGNLLAQFVLNGFYYYWSIKDEIIDYFLIDYLIATAYDHLPQVQSMIDEVTPSHPALFKLRDRMNLKYREDQFLALQKDTGLFKLNYRDSLSDHTIVEQQTYYGWILQQEF